MRASGPTTKSRKTEESPYARVEMSALRQALMCRSLARGTSGLVCCPPAACPRIAVGPPPLQQQQRPDLGVAQRFSVAANTTSERCAGHGLVADAGGALAAALCGAGQASVSWRNLSSLSDAEGGSSVAAVGLAAPPAPQQQPKLHLESLLGGPLDPSPMVPPPKPVVIVISGPSGVGKDTVVARLKELREDLYFVVTATSRPKRSSEVEGRDYFFVARDKFEQWIADDMLLEHALVYGDYKGIPRQQVDDALRAGTDVVLRIDVQGAATVKRLLPDAITIFVTAEDEATLVQRLVARKTESADKLAVRVRTARAEVARVHEFDYVVVNGTGALETCVAQVSGIIDAEKARVSRRYAGVARGAPVGLQDASQQ